VVLLDYYLPDMDSAALNAVKGNRIDTVLRKPFRAHELVKAIDKASDKN